VSCFASAGRTLSNGSSKESYHGHAGCDYGAVAKVIGDLGFHGCLAHEFVLAAKYPLKSLEDTVKLRDA
jgi:hypothetical protein